VVATDVVGNCLPGAVERYYHQPLWLGWLFLLGVTLVTAVPYYTAFAASYWLLARRFRAALPLLAGAAWTAAELGRVKLLGGNPWGVAGYSQVGFMPVMQIAAVTGVYGMSFLVVSVNAAIAQAWVALFEPGSSRREAVIGSLATAAVLALSLAYGGSRLGAANAATESIRPVELAIIQGNLDLGSQWRSEMYGRNLDEYLRLTNEAMRARAPALVFWPESALTFFIDSEPAYQAAIGRILSARDVQLVTGGPRMEGSADAPRYFNSTFVVSPEGKPLAWYDKQHLLPFAEYFPLRSLDLLRRRFERVRQFTPGSVAEPLPTIAGRAGVIVCNEAMFPEPARERVSAGADYLVNPANDSWFGDLKFSTQVFDIVRLRAVEEHRYLVRTSTAGPSAIIDPSGHVIARTEPFTRAWIAGPIAPDRSSTAYHRIGDLFAYFCALVTLGACALAATSIGREHGPRQERDSP